ncbi:MAG: KpsF/GutQ family sugar-phosphate isomerase [Gammaproteobacteria bacterium]|nr:KpsF/GutQ family sugar-phosphate isomerase [Gammaproteobacteria bacterium]
METLTPISHSTKDLQSEALRETALKVVISEGQALLSLKARIDHHFVKACRFLLACKGKVVATGMGKSGHIARKIAATLASTGCPAFFVHPADASHGDLGMITASDLVLILSNSGETEEVLTILPLIKRLGCPLVSLTGNARSTLATSSDVHLDVSVEREACPMNLAPTASTTVALVMGDALAMAIQEAKGFTPEDFARSHPSGRLGRKLWVRIIDVMKKGEDVPRVLGEVMLREALIEMSRKKLGMTAVVDKLGRPVGIFTDGDLRRILEKDTDIYRTPVSELMTKHCKTIASHALAHEALQIMEAHKINALLVTDTEGLLIGALNMHDLFRAGVV